MLEGNTNGVRLCARFSQLLPFGTSLARPTPDRKSKSLLRALGSGGMRERPSKETDTMSETIFQKTDLRNWVISNPYSDSLPVFMELK